MNEDEKLNSIQLEKVIFKKAITLSITTTVLLLILDQFYFEDYKSVIIETVALILLTVFLLASQNEQRLSQLILPFILFMFVILNLGWYVGGGFNSGLALLYLLAVYVSLIIIPRTMRIAIIMAIAMNLIFMMILEFNHQEIREFNSGSKSNLMATYILISITYLLCTYLIFYVKNKFEEAREYVFDQNKRLDRQAGELLALNARLSQINENLESMVDEKTRQLEEYNKKLLGFAASNIEKVSNPVYQIVEITQGSTPQDSKVKLEESIHRLNRTAKVLDMEVREMNYKLEKEELE